MNLHSNESEMQYVLMNIMPIIYGDYSFHICVGCPIAMISEQWIE